MPKRLLILALTAFFFALPAARAAGPLEDALAAYEEGNFRRAAALLAPLAERGDPLAQLKLGMLYYMGKGVPENEKTALTWLKRSADQGQIEAMFQLGNLYAFGEHAGQLSPEPDREAALWYFHAASRGHAEAQHTLGLMFLAGKGVAENSGEGIRWIRRAAANGHREAKRFISSLDSLER